MYYLRTVEATVGTEGVGGAMFLPQAPGKDPCGSLACGCRTPILMRYASVSFSVDFPLFVRPLVILGSLCSSDLIPEDCNDPISK